ncbi:hypothetical protein CPB83DRAFT_909398 [Crepidotus variabilis]|uniref:NAD-dependent epimerase/dehydratase domain-containing protein n=1 Tax=Crepidotus variabilis TaxID=179855 RepID=A0A9P6E9W4_9AGAR|nr:hypothetical protein CPB83DRAFT_909398 [Crepidotus variabilis]
MSGTQSALIIGATGQVGRHLLQSLLVSPHYSRVGEYGRRVTPAEDIKEGKDRLEQKTIDFENLGESGLKDGKWDVVYITLGTSRATAGSAEKFEKIDREYVINAAKEARNPEVAAQRIVYCSSVGANPSSSFLYPRSKGLTEEGLAAIGYADTIVFRPGFLAGTARPEPRLVETIYGKLTGLLSHVSDGVEINISKLGQSLYLAGKYGSAALPAGIQSSKAGKPESPFTLLNNAAALKLAEVQE